MHSFTQSSPTRSEKPEEKNEFLTLLSLLLSSEFKQQKLGLDRLSQLSTAAPSIHEAALGAGMLPPATKLLASPSEAVQLSACLCLGNLAMNPACRDVIIKEGAIPLLSTLLSSASDSLLDAASFALINITAPIANIQGGAEELVGRLMALLVHDNREIRLNCLKVLVNISLYGSFNSLILDSPHFSNLTIFLLSSDDDLALRAVAILGNLSTRDGGEAQQTIYQKGFIGILMSLLARKSVALRENVMVALEKLTTNYPPVRQQIIESENLQDMIKCIEASEPEELQLRTISLLATLGSKNKFGEHERLRALASSSSSPSVAYQAQQLLEKLPPPPTDPPAPAQPAIEVRLIDTEVTGRPRSRAIRAGGAQVPRLMDLLATREHRDLSANSATNAHPDSCRRFIVSSAETIGRRATMEDTLLVHGCFRGREDEDVFAVFDGHGGREVAEFAAANLVRHLAAHLETNEPPAALHKTFLALNEELSAHSWSSNCGATALVALIVQSNLIVANAGDTRAVLCRDGRAVRLTVDHKPELPEETSRIVDRGGFVRHNRVNGVLAVSRALGDGNLQPHVSAEPHIHVTQLTPSDSFLILACDGVWDVLTDEQAVELVASVPDKQHAAAALRDAAYAGGSGDNITVVVVIFKKEAQ